MMFAFGVRSLPFLCCWILLSSCRKQAVPIFDGQSAYAFLSKQCDFGPRVPGSAAHRKCLNFLTTELQRFGAQVVLQKFEAQPSRFPAPITMTNIIASFGVEKAQRVLLCAHWDSRPWADREAPGIGSISPVPGANDGASGVAVLLEVARHLQSSQPEPGVDIILFDGEDAGEEEIPDSYALGAQYFAANKDEGYHPVFGILLDMVGDKDLQIYQEENSLRYAPRVVENVWRRADALRLPAFHPGTRFEVTDDHLPLLRAGIPCIDIIDFDYAYWHTTQDTPDKCSAESLGQVGQLVLSLLYE